MAGINNHKDLAEEISALSINSNETKSEVKKCSSSDHLDGRMEGDSTEKDMIPPGYNLTSAREDDEAYNMTHKSRGHCVIFNHGVFDRCTNLGERSGTNRDRDCISFLFERLGFQVKVYNDLVAKKVKEVLDEYSYEIDHSDCDAFILVFMSHGEGGNLYARDDIFKSERLYSNFTADNCPSLAGKPKMFFIQACRGDLLDQGSKMLYKADQTDSGNFSMYKIPNHADFLVCYSTVPGHFSWRNTSNGSWFIQSIVKVFGMYAGTLDVLTMMTYVNRHMIVNFQSNCPSNPDMHGKKQTASVVSTLMRQIYLHPKP